MGDEFTQNLRLFYQRLFPGKQMHRWLSYGAADDDSQEDTYFPRREWSFTLADDVYIRFQSFQDWTGLQKELLAKNPHKIDIGAVYNTKPKEKNCVGAFLTVERELVFDVDLTDYDEIRTCCTGATICSKCWIYMTAAIKVTDACLREDFGFEHILWIYSGRRGVHCWVCDTRARRMTDEVRRGVIEYMSVLTGKQGPAADAKTKGANADRRVNITSPLHPSHLRAYNILIPYFEQLVEEQALFDTQEHWQKMLEVVPDIGLRSTLDSAWASDSKGLSGLDKWEQLKQALTDKKLPSVIHEIVFWSSYPRLDVEVSKHQNHLLKSPFCIHPKTDRVCVPMFAHHCEEFNPDDVPKLSELLEQINNYAGNPNKPNGRPVSDVKKTKLGPYIKQFKEQFLNPLLRSMRDQRAKRERPADW